MQALRTPIGRHHAPAALPALAGFDAWARRAEVTP
jgi:hypothetical protein